MDVTCSECGWIHYSEEAHIGKHLRCARCGAVAPILEAARGVVRQTATAPPAKSASRVQQTTLAKSATRFKSGYTMPLAVGVLSIIGIALLPNFLHTDKPQTQQEQLQAKPSPQDTNIDFQIIDAEPIPKRDKHPHVDDSRPIEYNSPPTGTRIIDSTDSNGNGELTVENGTSNDAVICLNRSDSDVNVTVLGFFVKTGSTAHIHKIPQGTYNVAFTTGLNWVEDKGEFSWHPEYNEFERTFDFSEQRIGGSIQYDSLKVTLHTVPHGNISARTVTREQFLKGHKRIALLR